MVAAAVALVLGQVAYAQEELGEVVVTGTRRADVSATESLSPIDIVDGSDIAQQAAFDMTEPAVVAIGTELLAYLSVSGLFITVALTYTGGLQGTGDTRSPFYISLISQIAVPIGICLVLESTTGLTPARIWLAIVAGHATRCLLSVVRFRQGKWKSMRVIEPIVVING